jgi:predicted secreted protein
MESSASRSPAKTRDRSRRHPLGRHAYRQIYKVKAWSDPKLVSVPDPTPTPNPAPAPATDGAASRPKRDRATRIVLLVLIAMVAVNFGAAVGQFGWSMLQALGWVAEPAIESVQRRQGDSISELDATVHALSGAVAGMAARVDSAADRAEAASRRMVEIDGTLGALRMSMNEIRATQATAEESWREPVAELTASAAKTRSEMVRLRASVEELSRSRQSELGPIGARIDRVEQAMIQHNLLGPIRGAIQEPGARRGASPPREGPPATDGHIINLSPAN